MDIGDIKYLEVKEAPKVLRLSEAIRIGARIRPQCFCGSYMHAGTSCALGAAAEAMGHKYVEGRDFPEVFYVNTYPARRAYNEAYGAMIIEDNDHGMPREVIADRLAALGY